MTEMVMEYRYKLRMLGVQVEGPSLMLGDNMSVIVNTSVPSSQLKKKHHACAFHRLREFHACQVVNITHVDLVDNLADVLTKPLPAAKFTPLVGKSCSESQTPSQGRKAPRKSRIQGRMRHPRPRRKSRAQGHWKQSRRNSRKAKKQCSLQKCV